MGKDQLLLVWYDYEQDKLIQLSVLHQLNVLLLYLHLLRTCILRVLLCWLIVPILTEQDLCAYKRNHIETSTSCNLIYNSVSMLDWFIVTMFLGLVIS